MSEVRVDPKNMPTAKVAATSTSTFAEKTSRRGARWAVASSPTVTTRAVGCRANAVTNARLSAAAIAIGAHGAMRAARMPTRNGPITNAVSSAADS